MVTYLDPVGDEEEDVLLSAELNGREDSGYVVELDPDGTRLRSSQQSIDPRAGIASYLDPTGAADVAAGGVLSWV